MASNVSLANRVVKHLPMLVKFHKFHSTGMKLIKEKVTVRIKAR